MSPVTVLGVIPARWGSTRFPGKPLARLAGRPLIQHVYQHARQARLVDRIVVATDDRRIAAVVEAFGGEVVLTDSAHPTGSDRVAQVALSLPAGIVVNIQGDEPLLPPEAMNAAVRPLIEDATVQVATLAAPLAPPAAAADPHVVKVVVDRAGYALYFSRGIIPHHLTFADVPPPPLLYHLGLYAFRYAFLQRFTSWPQTPLEKAEKLEQLRILEHGHRIRVLKVEAVAPGVDTPEDLERLERLLESDA
ncbi:MAG: 3-deoxy-manno-octulosonate cytidylyltransferase [Acidobacteriota bacterium]